MAEPHRLPRNVVPTRYELTLRPDLATATFAGDERVTITVADAVDAVVLNAVDLDVDAAAFVAADGVRVIAEPAVDAGAERLTLRPERTLAAGEWTLELRFRGVLNDKLRGFYRSTYRDAAGGEHAIATTQFEATHARRAFPCWDEPDFKAVFATTLVVPDGYLAVSNTSVIDESAGDGGTRVVRFADSMVMSTYLVAFVVAPFAVTDPVDVDGVPLRVVAPPDKLALAGYALDIGAASLRFFAGYFGLPYPGDKLDLIAIPDFAFGAMENLGAVTFRETALLVDGAAASRLELERVAQVVAHEIAHMWFGDLVTMKWWNGIWLNEAFATFMELLCVDDFRPGWATWVGFGVSRAGAMAVDGLTSTRPVEYPVGPPEEAEGMFDVLTYQKGCAVLRMLEQHLGGDRFRDGIRRYLSTHAHSNTETSDLWDAIEATSGEPARAVMDSWIFQPGHPLVSVEPDPSGVRLAQRRFLYVGDVAGADGPGGATWRIPVALRARVDGRQVERRLLLDGPGATVDLGGPAEWVVANAGAAGFYRVAYEPSLLDGLTGVLHDELDALERFDLMSDTWAAALAGHASLADLTTLMARYRAEADPDVWSIVAAPVRLLDKIAANAERPALEAWVRALAGPALAAVGWSAQPDDDERTGQLRSLLVAVLGTVGADEVVQARCRQLHDAELAERGSVDADLLDALVAVVADSGGADDYERFLDRFSHPATPQEEMRYLMGLGRFPHPALVDRTLRMTVTDQVRTQNAPLLLSQMLAGRHSGALTWAFVQEQWDTLCGRFPDMAIARMVEGLAAQASAELAASARDFFAAHDVPNGDLQVAQTVERLDVNAAFAARVAGSLDAALEAALG